MTRHISLPQSETPSVFQQADRSSTRAQQGFLRATAIVLASLALAALMGAIGTKWAGWIGGASFLVALVVGALAITRNLERTWYDGRALAESAKSLTWLYVARGSDLAEVPDPDAELRERLRALRAELADFDFVVATEGPDITERMRELRAQPLNERRDLYLAERIGDQIRYYRTRGRDHERKARTFRTITSAAQLFGLGGALLQAVGVVSVDLLGLGAAAAAALTAWLQTRDHVTAARAYRLTAEDLERVLEDAPDETTEAAWAPYVADAEAAMSREHVMWLARRGRRN